MLGHPLCRQSINIWVFVTWAEIYFSSWVSIKLIKHVILSVGPSTQLMMGFTLNVGGLVDATSSANTNLFVLIRKYKTGHVGKSIFSCEIIDGFKPAAFATVTHFLFNFRYWLLNSFSVLLIMWNYLKFIGNIQLLS